MKISIRILLSAAVSLWILSCCGGGAEVGSNTASNGYTLRNNYNAVLEMDDKVLHGAGQDPGAFALYYGTMPAGNKPLIYMTYYGLNSIDTGSLDSLKNTLASYDQQGIYLIPQIGLSMTSDGTPSANYERAVANGDYDSQINALCDEISGLGHPVFVRIGYEFNGLAWNGYEPSAYIAVFKRITNAFRTHNLEVATVWCAEAATLNNTNYTYDEFYPGDSYVDWWGIDTFSTSELTASDTLNFLWAAHAHGKPVMVGESTPRYVGVTDGLTDWNTWFEPYFHLIQDNPGIKAFCYINWNWNDYVHMWSPSWGDARIQANEQVRQNYLYKISSDLYYHGNSETGLRSALGVDDTTLPSQVTGLSSSYAAGQVDLSWTAATDNTRIIRYEIFNNGEFLGLTVSTNYTDKVLKAGSTNSYTVLAVDSGGNEGPASAAHIVAIPSSIEKVFNGNFEDGLDNWIEREYGCTFVSSLETASPISGSRSAKIEVTNGTGTNWHCQFSQYFTSFSGVSYRLFFKIMADAATTVDVFLQQNHDPYGSILIKSVNVTTTAQTFTFSSGTPSDDDKVLTFMFGNCDGRTIWIDDVSLTETE